MNIISYGYSLMGYLRCYSYSCWVKIKFVFSLLLCVGMTRHYFFLFLNTRTTTTTAKIKTRPKRQFNFYFIIRRLLLGVIGFFAETETLIPGIMPFNHSNSAKQKETVL